MMKEAVLLVLLVVGCCAALDQTNSVIFVSKDIPAGEVGPDKPGSGKFGTCVDHDDPTNFGDFETVTWEHHYYGCNTVKCAKPYAMRVGLADEHKKAYPDATIKKVLECQKLLRADESPEKGFMCQTFRQYAHNDCANVPGKCEKLGLGKDCRKCADYQVCWFCTNEQTNKAYDDHQKKCKLEKPKTPYKRKLVDLLSRLFGKEKVSQIEHEMYDRRLSEKAEEEQRLVEEKEEEKNMQRKELNKLLLQALGEKKAEEKKQEAERRLLEQQEREREIKQREVDEAKQKESLRELLEDLTN